MKSENPAASGGRQSAIAGREFFYVGGRYVGEPGRRVMHGQMYVEALTPREPRRPFPLVLIHGGGQTMTNWLGTPDGRPGWAEFFAGEGYTIYLVDQPARGRSPWQPGIDGELTVFTAEALERLMTATAAKGDWPQARQHTQWPGSGQVGDPVFDAFFATQVPYLADAAETQRLVQQAGAALLDRIGPAILLTHSQSGPFGWLLADARPALVKAIVAVEPSGPPFEGAVLSQGPARAWGLTDIPMTYDPPARDPAELQIERQAEPEGPGLVRCWQQKAPPRRLPNLAGKPVLVLTAEASYHAVYDHCTIAYLQAAGVEVSVIRLAERGLRGNGHMVMLERNNLAIAGLIAEWLSTAVIAG
ncbi:MAG: alpha/beta fold hydrolase [Alphaproteobacteria bacterium]|nr:alpha/beta fold hydrolase [Alphaproteobacteria bacterium]